MSVPDLLKIGGTAGSITKRANDLSRPTGVPTPFIPVMKIKTDNWRVLEKSIHTYLNELRIPNKEFFKISEEELYTKLTEEMKLTVEKITETDDGQNSEGGDSEGGDIHDDGGRGGCLHLRGGGEHHGALRPSLISGGALVPAHGKII